IRSGYVQLDGDQYPVLRLNSKSRDVLLHNGQVSLTKPEEPILIRKDKRDEEYDRTLFDCLRTLRKAIADQEEMPPYVIFHDTSLKEMSIYYPQSDPDPRLNPSKTLTTQATLGLYRQGLTIGEIAQKRGLTITTIVSHLERLVLEGEDISIDSFITPERQLHIKQALEEQGAEFLSPVREKLGEGYSYEEIRLVRAKMNK